jgi:hypothetical protein
MGSGVEFDTDLSSAPQTGGGRYIPPQGYEQPGATSGIAGWLMRHGLAKNARAATVILFVVIVFNIAVIYWAWHSSSSAVPPQAAFPGEHVLPDHYVNTIYTPPR